MIAATILLGALPFLFAPREFFPDHRLLPYLFNASHIPLFFLLTWFGINILGPSRASDFFGALVICNLVVMLIGIGVESIQAWQGRQGSIGDLVMNALGASLAIVLHPRTPQPRRAVRISLLSGMIVFLLVALYPLYANTVDWIHARTGFPILADFETPFQRGRWLAGEIVRPHDSANRAIGFRFDLAPYSTLSFVHFDGDWRGYDCFKFRIYNPQDENVRLNLRINDRVHDLVGQRFDDRFNFPLIVVPGWSSYSIPLEIVELAPRNRTMDLAQIERVLFFSSSLKSPATLYFDDLVLGKSPASCQTGTNQPANRQLSRALAEKYDFDRLQYDETVQK